MFIPFLISRIQNARVTKTDATAAHCVAIDSDILKSAGIYEFQKVELSFPGSDVTIETHVAPAEAGSREIWVNGPLAAGIKVGSNVVITAYALLDERELNSRSVVIIFLDDKNNRVRIVNGKI